MGQGSVAGSVRTFRWPPIMDGASWFGASDDIMQRSSVIGGGRLETQLDF
jgi:hypothetical protein